MDINALSDLLEKTPVVASIHPVSVAFLKKIPEIVDTPQEVIKKLDSPEPFPPKNYLINTHDPTFVGRFPRVKVLHNPFTEEINTVLYEKFDDISKKMLLQSQASNLIVSESRNIDIAIMFLIDGLSYRDIEAVTKNFNGMITTPCLVDGPTITNFGFTNFLGKPNLARRLFDCGFYTRVGFSYWSRETNPQTDEYFSSIQHVVKTANFHEIRNHVEEIISNLENNKAYIQIVRTGLDSFVHSNKRMIPVEAIVSEIFDEVVQIWNLCNEFNKKMGYVSRIYLTSDHGVLWKDEFSQELIGNDIQTNSPRYCLFNELKNQKETGKKFIHQNKEYYCLDIPKVRRGLRIDEQGVHGGISFQESIIPFITIKVG